jgi:hypothetical protein
MEGAANLTWWEFLNFHHATHKTAHEEFNLESIETAICTSCISIMPDTQKNMMNLICDRSLVGVVCTKR